MMINGYYSVTVQFMFNGREFYLMIPILFEERFSDRIATEAAVMILHELNPDARFVKLMDITQR
jgi:hypothetical protein